MAPLTHQRAELSGRQGVEGLVGGGVEGQRPLLAQQLRQPGCLEATEQQAERRAESRLLIWSQIWEAPHHHQRTSPEALVLLQDIHDRPCGRSQDFVHNEQGAKSTRFVTSSDAGVLDAQVLDTRAESSGWDEPSMGLLHLQHGDHTSPDHTGPDHTRPDHIRPDQPRPNQTGPDHRGGGGGEAAVVMSSPRFLQLKQKNLSRTFRTLSHVSVDKHSQLESIQRLQLLAMIQRHGGQLSLHNVVPQQLPEVWSHHPTSC